MEVDNSDSSNQQRTLEHVRAAAKAAGIPPSNNTVQLLQFSNTQDSEEIKLLQLPSEVKNALTLGERVVLRGDKDENAVLCTNSTTYDLRIGETSNSLLLCPSLLYPNEPELRTSGHLVTQEVTGCLFDVLELRKCRPKLEKLKQLLWESPYRGPLEEEKDEEKRIQSDATTCHKYTLSDMLDVIQASETEIMDELHKMEACLIDGYWRVFDLDYRDEVFQHILTLLEEKDWSWKMVLLDMCCESLSELHPPFVIRHCLDCYGVPQVREEDGKVIYELIEERVCQFYAELLLRPAGKFNYQEFMESWQQSVPLGMTTDLKQLKGLAMTDMNTMPPVIWHFPVDNLPQEPADRFAKLFRTREKWTYDSLEPYVKDLSTPTQSLNALLLKYTRSSTNPNGVKTYNAKQTAL